MSHPDDTLVVMTVAEIGDQVGRTRQAVRVILHKAQRKVAAALLERLGPAVVDLVRNEPLRHNDPRTTR